ncbi:hypothetical protein OROMI_002814 [Orobanche minor]
MIGDSGVGKSNLLLSFTSDSLEDLSSTIVEIGGCDIQKQEIREAVEQPLTHHELYQRIGIDPPALSCEMSGGWCASRFIVQVTRGETPFCTKVLFPSTVLGTGENWILMKTISVTEYLNYEAWKFSNSKVVLLICVTKVAKSAFDKALAEHEDIDDAVGSEEPTERDHGVDLQQPLLIKIDSSDIHLNKTYS